MKIVVIGGGAGGSSFAARMRRLDEKAEIIILEQTSETSIASCGLPYFIGGVITDRKNMQVASPDLFKQLFNIEVRLNSKVTKIDPQNKIVTINNEHTIPYDKLILATGAKPYVPEIKGIENIAHFTLKHLADADKIKALIKERHLRSATVVGGGFIGVEVAENLARLGIKTSLVELSEQILAPVDIDIARLAHHEMRQHGVELFLSDGIKQITAGKIELNSGKIISSEMLILAIGVRPETSLAQSAGISVNERGAIITNEYMQTNFADIYACGDSVVVSDFVSRQSVMVALAGPANRQGRLIADHIAQNHPYPYKSTQGTGIVKVFDLTVAFTGNNEKQLQRNNIAYEKMIINGSSHAGYYPGGTNLTLKVLYSAEGKILGAQAIGKDGVDKRIDVIATIMRLGGSTADLRDAELCYAPPYSGAKDPVNLIGMAIENVRQGLVKPYFGTDFFDMLVLDVRPANMYEQAHIHGAINVPAAQIRNRLGELPKDKPIMIHCVKGYTSYVVARILAQYGFENIFSYAGGWTFYQSQIQE